MKKSEKEKGKARVEAESKKLKLIVGGLVAAVLVITVIGYVFFNPSGARAGDTVSVYYTGSLEDGTVFDSNQGSTPLIITLGQGKYITGFEEAVIGMTVNSTKTVKIPVDKAYGPYRNDLVHVVNRSTLPADLELKVGERYSIRRSTDGAVALVKVINITPSTVTWDENHDLAGKDLGFTIMLAKISRS